MRAATTLIAAIDALEPRRLLAGDFSIDVPSSITVPAGKTIQVPVTTENGSEITFDADPSGGINAGFRSDANPWLELVTSRGTMRFQLFADLADDTVRKIRGLVDGGFYEGKDFGRVVDQYGFRIAQGGVSNATQPALSDDEFNPDAIFTGYGQLATANRGKDEVGTGFLVTGGTARSLDFNNTVFGQLVRGADVLESILTTADPNADPDVGTPLATTTIQSARIIGEDRDAVMQVRASSKTGTRSVVVTATDGEGNSVSRTVRVRVVGEADNTPPVLRLDEKYNRIRADAGSTITIPFGVIDLENEPYDVGVTVLQGGFESGLVRDGTTYDKTSLTLQIQADFVGEIKVKLGVRGLNAVSRGFIMWKPGEDNSLLRVYDTQVIRVSVGGTPIEKVTSPATLAARVGNAGSLDDAVLATFRSHDDADEDDFGATINWGDGSALEPARIERIDKGAFRVVAADGHAYARAADGIPVEVEISGANGSTTTSRLTAVVGDPATLTSDGLLTIRGTAGDDRVRLESDDNGKLIVRLNDERFTFTQTSVSRIGVELFDGDDELLTVDAEGLPPMTLRGGAGNDSLYGGEAADEIFGEAGNDQLYGNSGDDSVYGGDGDDTILGGGGKNFLYGEAGADRIIGGGGRDLISGGEDADKLYGRSGNDTIEGNAGTDRLYGEDGDDRLIGGSSNDRLYGGEGNDTLWGNQGNDTVNGGPGTNYRGDRDDGDTLVDVVDLVA